MLHRIFFAISFVLISTFTNASVYGVFYGKVYDGLRSTENDVTALTKVYRNNRAANGDTLKGGIFLIRGDGVTKHNVIKYFTKQAVDSDYDDILVFAYSGHGNRNGIFCGEEFITFKEIVSIFNISKAKTKIMYIGSCFSGGAFNAINCYNLSDKENFIVFTSSGIDEYSYEEVNANYSYFFRYLILGLKGYADKDNNGTINARELFTFIYDGVDKDTDFLGNKKEHPMMFGRFNENTVLMQWR